MAAIQAREQWHYSIGEKKENKDRIFVLGRRGLSVAGLSRLMTAAEFLEKIISK